MLRKVTITSYGQGFIQDKAALESYNDGQQFVSLNLKAGQTVSVIMTEGQWDRVRPELVRLSQARLPIAGTSKTQPVITYVVDYVPGLRARKSYVHGSISLAGGAQQIVLKGTSLIPGVQATGSYLGLSLTAVSKGPLGNLTDVEIAAASGGGSVSVAHGADGAVHITVVPAAGAISSNAIAAQIAGNTEAATHVTAAGSSGSDAVYPVKSIKLTGGDGAGAAKLEVVGADGASVLELDAVKPGNGGNVITLTIAVSQGANSVAVSGTDITVNRTEATPTFANIVTALSGNAAASALVAASQRGGGTLPAGGLAKTWFYGGSGEDVVATVGGAAATVVSHTDTTITLSVTGAAVGATGAVATDSALVQILTGYGSIEAQVAVGA